MKKIIQLSMVLLFVQASFFAGAQSVAINEDASTADASSILDVKSITKGMLVPRMSTAQRGAIAAPATGLLVFDNTTNSFWFRTATNWVELADSTGNIWKRNGANVYLNSTGNVGIGTVSPGSDITIYRPSPSISLYDANPNKDTSFSGSVYGDSIDLFMNAFRKSIFVGNRAGNIVMQTGTTGLFTAGYVGIGIDTPKAKLHVVSNMMVGAGSPLSGYEFNVTGDGYFSKSLLVGNGSALSGYEMNVNGDAHVNGTTYLNSPSSGEVLKLEGTNPFIQMYQGGVAKAYIWQTGNNLQLGNSTSTNPSGNVILYGNQVAIGTSAPATGYKLSVYGKVICEELKVQLKANWPDYVFSDKYKLADLNSVEQYIKENKHLPNIPSAETIGTSGGIEVGEMQRKMMEKIEELTLYIIDLKKQVDELKGTKGN